MPGKSAAARQSLARIETAILGVFTAAGFEQIAPDILQPADIFLERSGEDIRNRTYVFADPSGAEMCLRPDLTVPACRYHLSHAASAQAEARYCYSGPVFRFADETNGANETVQTGVEWLGGGDAERAEAEVLRLACASVEAAGLTHYRVLTGDLGLFRALIDDFEIPERWRRRLKHHFWRPQAFRDLLASISGDAIRLRTSISAHVDAIAAGEGAGFVIRKFADEGHALQGGRTVEEITARLMEKAADRSERPLSRAEAQRIQDYLAIAGSPAEAAAAFTALDHGKRFAAATERFVRRAELLTGAQHFAAIFGRSLEYYTGFVFQIEADGPEGPVQVAGGGRYDDLLSDIGAPLPVPAVGCAVFPERIAGLSP